MHRKLGQFARNCVICFPLSLSACASSILLSYSTHLNFFSLDIYSSVFLLFIFIFIFLSIVSFNWIIDLFIEFSLFFATLTEATCLLIGFKLFILSEFILFSSCFWTYIDYRLIIPSLNMFSVYPLLSGLFNASFSIPLSNLFILLYSSFALQSSALFVKLGVTSYTIESLGQCLCCGLLFLVLQLKEFIFSLFSMSSSAIGSIYYFTTGLHGIHVIIGSYSFFMSLFFLTFLALSFLSFLILLLSTFRHFESFTHNYYTIIDITLIVTLTLITSLLVYLLLLLWSLFSIVLSL